MKIKLCASVIILSISTSAQATVSCEVLETPDGFVALRSVPSTTAKPILKLKPGDLVRVGNKKNGGWEQVIFYQRKDSAPESKPVSGWIKNKFLTNICG